MTSVEADARSARRERLADTLYDQFIERILNGAFRGGERLPTEKRICEEFRVSRPVVREALKRLRTEGFIQSRQGSGSFVTAQPPSDIPAFADSSEVSSHVQVLEPRIALESEAARLAALRRRRSDLDALEAAMDRLSSSAGDKAERCLADFDLHLAISAASGNEMFPRLLLSERDAIMRTMTVEPEMMRECSVRYRGLLMAEHRQIIDAITTADGEGAALYMRYHLIQARSRLTDARSNTRSRNTAVR